MVIGVTGSIGAGKSVVSEILAEYNMYIIDCDKISHSIDSVDEYKNKIKETFGEGVFTESEIDRKKLSEVVFKSKENVKKLESISFPVIIDEIHRKRDMAFKNGQICVYDAPTLFNAGLDKECDYTIGVIAEKEKRIERAIMRGNLSEKEIIARVLIQPDDDYYREKCNFIIDNSGTLGELKEQIEVIVKKIKEKEVSYGN